MRAPPVLWTRTSVLMNSPPLLPQKRRLPLASTCGLVVSQRMPTTRLPPHSPTMTTACQAWIDRYESPRTSTFGASSAKALDSCLQGGNARIVFPIPHKRPRLLANQKLHWTFLVCHCHHLQWRTSPGTSNPLRYSGTRRPYGHSGSRSVLCHQHPQSEMGLPMLLC